MSCTDERVALTSLPGARRCLESYDSQSSEKCHCTKCINVGPGWNQESKGASAHRRAQTIYV